MVMVLEGVVCRNLDGISASRLVAEIDGPFGLHILRQAVAVEVGEILLRGHQAAALQEGNDIVVHELVVGACGEFHDEGNRRYGRLRNVDHEAGELRGGVRSLAEHVRIGL